MLQLPFIVLLNLQALNTYKLLTYQFKAIKDKGV